MEFPDLTKETEALCGEFSNTYDVPAGEVRVLASPYRIAPLGAHIDHQGGPVLGMAVSAYTLMVFTPSPDKTVRLHSKNYPDSVTFDLDRISGKIPGAWGYYARGAALALAEAFDLNRGITGMLNGMLPGCGLSSSASVLLAYLFALTDANGIQLAPWDYVRLTQRAENHHIGLKNGILDQTSIVFGRENQLLHIDTITPDVEKIPDTPGEKSYRILIAYSGYSRELTATGYNTRVQECRAAAEALSRLEGRSSGAVLSDIPENVFRKHGEKLNPLYRRRASHYFGEVQRVHDGINAWREGNLSAFGRLMNESCNSSVTLYECGSPAVHDLQQIVSATDGVLGSRFSGGGFGGCVVGLVRPALANRAVSEIKDKYIKRHPEVTDRAAVYLARSVKGVDFL